MTITPLTQSVTVVSQLKLLVKMIMLQLLVYVPLVAIVLSCLSRTAGSSLCDAIDANIISYNHSHPLQSMANISSEFISKHCHRCPLQSEFLLTVILLYHNECDLLYYQTSAWLRLPKDLTDRILFLVVDDHSLIPACSCIPTAPQNSNTVVDVIRIDSSNIWNIGGARNLGAYYACTDFLFISDIDAFLSEKILRQVNSLLVEKRGRYENGAIQLNRKTHKERYGAVHTIHPGLMVLTRKLYWELKGCDEDFVGHYGYTDKHFMYRLKHHGYNEYPQEDIHVHLLHSSLQKKMQPMLPGLSRNFWHNFRLFNRKMNGSVPWSDRFLRFDWHIGCAVSASDLRSQHDYAEVVALANHSLSEDSIASNIRVMYEWI